MKNIKGLYIFGLIACLISASLFSSDSDEDVSKLVGKMLKEEVARLNDRHCVDKDENDYDKLCQEAVKAYPLRSMILTKRSITKSYCQNLKDKCDQAFEQEALDNDHIQTVPAIINMQRNISICKMIGAIRIDPRVINYSINEHNDRARVIKSTNKTNKS